MSQPFKALAPGTIRSPEISYLPPFVSEPGSAPCHEPPDVISGGDYSFSGLSDTVTGSIESNPCAEALTFLWEYVSGPAGGEMTIASPTALSTLVTVTVAGTYVIKLSSTDGYWTVTDYCNVITI